MKKKLRFKVALTNMRRVIMSILFINMSTFFQKDVKAINSIQILEPTCYAVGPTGNIVTVGDRIIDLCQSVFILAVPIAFIILLIVFIIKKNRKKNIAKNDK